MTVTALNYISWWINGGYESEAEVNGKLEYSNYVHATSSSGNGANTHDVLEGGWYRASVPIYEKGKGNTIIITVDPHNDTKPRTAVIEMQTGDAFTKINISQR